MRGDAANLEGEDPSLVPVEPVTGQAGAVDQADDVRWAIVGDNVVLDQGDMRLVIPFTEWNPLIERIGHRTPAEDKNCPP